MDSTSMDFHSPTTLLPALRLQSATDNPAMFIVTVLALSIAITEALFRTYTTLKTPSWISSAPPRTADPSERGYLSVNSLPQRRQSQSSRPAHTHSCTSRALLHSIASECAESTYLGASSFPRSAPAGVTALYSRRRTYGPATRARPEGSNITYYAGEVARVEQPGAFDHAGGLCVRLHPADARLAAECGWARSTQSTTEITIHAPRDEQEFHIASLLLKAAVSYVGGVGVVNDEEKW